MKVNGALLYSAKNTNRSLSESRWQGQQSEQRCPDVLFPSRLTQLFWGHGGISKPAEIHNFQCVIALTWGLIPAGRPKHFAGVLVKCPNHLEEQQLYSETLSNDRAPHLISEAEPRHPSEEKLANQRRKTYAFKVKVLPFEICWQYNTFQKAQLFELYQLKVVPFEPSK